MSLPLDDVGDGFDEFLASLEELEQLPPLNENEPVPLLPISDSDISPPNPNPPEPQSSSNDSTNLLELGQLTGGVGADDVNVPVASPSVITQIGGVAPAPGVEEGRGGGGSMDGEFLTPVAANSIEKSDGESPPDADAAPTGDKTREEAKPAESVSEGSKAQDGDAVGSPKGPKTGESDEDKDKDKNQDKSDSPDLKCKEAKIQESSSDDDIEIIGEKPGSEESKDKEKEDKKPGSDLSEDEESEEMPMIRMCSNIFETQDDDEEPGQDTEEQEQEVQMLDPDQLSNMMEVEVNFEDSMEVDEPRSGGAVSSRPKRAAAKIAENTIKVITSIEKSTAELHDQQKSSMRLDPTYRRRISEQAVAVQSHAHPPPITPSPNGCHQCKKTGKSEYVISQFGKDISLCSTKCFVAFRHPDPRTRPLPCAKCGTLSAEFDHTKNNYYWETMNFCSDVCVCEYQLQIGAKCSTCSKKTPWTCMGKYCVRFGSDIRQFCTAQCLESYKKSARVCFHCQLDIKRLGNVVLANIPTKASPKEFCSQECIGMYLTSNASNNPNYQRPKAPLQIYTCKTCRKRGPVHKELVSPGGPFYSCSALCWDRLLLSLSIKTPTPCETVGCTKWTNLDTGNLGPSFYISTEKRNFGFCSATCKNVFVLNTRQILSCYSCKVKKYNFDLIEYNHPRTTVKIAVCSLHCLPSPSPQVITLREQHKLGNVIFRPTHPNQYSNNLRRIALAHNGAGKNQEPEVIEIDDCSPDPGQQIQISSVTSLGQGNLTVRQINADDIVEIVDSQGKTELRVFERPARSTGTGDGDDSDYSDLGEEWADIDVLTIIQPPSPPQQRNKACQVWPIKFDKSIQTDTEELWAMPRIEMRVPAEPEPNRPFPILIPYPVYIPYPVLSGKELVPMPLAMPIPIPIPIPILLDKNIQLLRNISLTGGTGPSVSGVSAMETANLDSPRGSSGLGSPNVVPMVCEEDEADGPSGHVGLIDEEMMDTSSSGGKSVEGDGGNENDNIGAAADTSASFPGALGIIEEDPE